MLKLSENIVISSVDSELVLLDSVSGKYFGLNTTASRIMELLKEGNGEETICSIMAEEYGTPPERVNEDMNRLFDSLVKQGLAIRV